MPRVVITTQPVGDQQPTVVYEEHVVAAALESDHYAGQLLERVGWGIADAEEAEDRSR